MPYANWYPDELLHAGEEHMDADTVARYDRKAQLDVSPDIQVFQQLGLNSESVVVDLGAGTGTFAVAVASHCQQIIAVDVSSAMFDSIQQKAQESALTNLTAVQEGLLSYEHEGPPVDFVYSRNVLHHLSDFWKSIALTRIAAMLRPGGIMRLHDLTFAFEPADAESVIEPWLARAPLDPDDGYTREDLELHIRTEYSTFTWLLEPMIQHAGFEILDADYRNQTFAGYTCRKLFV